MYWYYIHKLYAYTWLHFDINAIILTIYPQGASFPILLAEEGSTQRGFLILNFVASDPFQTTADFRWYVWIFAPVTRTDPTNNILQELDLPHK